MHVSGALGVLHGGEPDLAEDDGAVRRRRAADGLLITTGVNLSLNSVLITGSLLVALLALSVDWIARVFEQVARPKGL